jgi:hypothetical protein
MSIVRFPQTVDDNGGDYIKFEFYNYTPAYQSGTTYGLTNTNALAEYNNSASTSTKKDTSLPAIYLPMPNDIGSKYSGKWAGTDLTTLMSGMLTQLKNIGELGTKITGMNEDKSANNVNELTPNIAGNVREQFYRLAATELNKYPGIGSNLTANDLLALGTGSIINPNTELLYGGSQLRNHGYTFKLIPQESADSTAIKNIVTAFRTAVLPRRQSAESQFGASARNFIGIPSVCQVSFVSSTNSNTSHLPSYKLSAITSVDVNYITDNQYMTYNDGAPLGVALTVTFTELKLLFREDVEGNTYR